MGEEIVNQKEKSHTEVTGVNGHFGDRTGATELAGREGDGGQGAAELEGRKPGPGRKRKNAKDHWREPLQSEKEKGRGGKGSNLRRVERGRTRKKKGRKEKKKSSWG